SFTTSSGLSLTSIEGPDGARPANYAAIGTIDTTTLPNGSYYLQLLAPRLCKETIMDSITLIVDGPRSLEWLHGKLSPIVDSARLQVDQVVGIKSLPAEPAQR